MAAESPKALKFNRSMRIKQGRDFSRIRQNGGAHGQRLSDCKLAQVACRLPGSAGCGDQRQDRRMPVVRNRARRLVREAFRLHQQHELAEPLDLVFVARASIVGKTFAGVEKDFLTTLRKIGLLRQSDKVT